MVPAQSPKTEVQDRRAPARAAAALACGQWATKAASRLHRDERGSISIATVFALLLLTMLLGMVINSGRQIDNKVKLQNAADATTYSGGIVLARGMNSLAFSNHMLAEIFALTAFFREARDRHAEPLVPPILAAWDRIGPILATSGFEKFDRLGAVIPSKTPLEQEMVTTYSEWMAASSEICLPVLEAILNEEMIPQFQRECVLAIPELSQTAAAEVADRHTSRPSPRDAARGNVAGVFWRTIVDPVGGSSEGIRGTLPAIDPVADPSGQYLSQARSDRNRYARHYLNLWNNAMLAPFDQEAKMCQFGSLWRSFTCGQLDRLMQEHTDRNFPHVIRNDAWSGGTNNGLEFEYTFVGVVYRKKLSPAAPRLFADSLAVDNQAYAQGMLFVPRSRIVWYWTDEYGVRHAIRQGGVAHHWDLWNQNWTFQLVPATSDSLPAILSAPPSTPFAAAASDLKLPNFLGVSSDDFERLTTH